MPQGFDRQGAASYRREIRRPKIVQDATQQKITVPPPEGPPLGNSSDALRKRRFQPGTRADEAEKQGRDNFLELKGDKRKKAGVTGTTTFAEEDSLRKRYDPTTRGERVADVTWKGDSTERAKRIKENTEMLEGVKKEVHESE